MKRRIACALFALAVASAARAVEPPATPTRDSLAAEIRQLESDINQLNDQIVMVPSREVALRQPLERQLREKQRALVEKQRALSALPPAEGAPTPGAASTATLRPIVKLFKDGKGDEAIARWGAWLKSKDSPKIEGPADLRLFAAWVAGQVSADPKARDAILQRLLDAAPKPAKE